MQISKLNKKTPLGIQAYDTLKDAIVCGRLQAGFRVTEEKAADFLGISRTPAREALRLLGQEGILDRSTRGGYTVPTPSLAKVTKITEVRKLLEPYAAQLTASRIRDEEVSDLRNAIDDEWNVIDDEGLGVFVSANCAVRTLLYELCGNAQLVDCIARYSDHLQFIGARTLVDKKMREVAVNGHERIFAAVSARDAKGAATATLQQINAAQRAAEEKLQ